jgi:hypothetical protein
MNFEFITQLVVPVLQANPYFSVFTAVVTLASTIAAVTPTPKKGTVLSKAYKIIDILALNIGKAKDKGE